MKFQNFHELPNTSSETAPERLTSPMLTMQVLIPWSIVHLAPISPMPCEAPCLSPGAIATTLNFRHQAGHLVASPIAICTGLETHKHLIYICLDCLSGNFIKWGYPQIIQNKLYYTIFQCGNRCLWGSPILKKPIESIPSWVSASNGTEGRCWSTECCTSPCLRPRCDSDVLPLHWTGMDWDGLG